MDRTLACVWRGAAWAAAVCIGVSGAAAEPLPDTDVGAKDVLPEADERLTTGQIDVIGARPDHLQHLPGSGTVITQEELEAQMPLSANEILRNVPGVNVVDEEGIGLRPNIGIRGLDPDRSRNLLVLEDGIPIALAPYGEPEMYYAPPIERMERLELVKGSGSILYGPQTIGGVLNYITRDPPKEFRTTAQARAGSFGYYLGEVTVGDTIGQVGYLISAMHHRFGGHRGLNLQRTDFNAKFRLQLSSTSSLGLRFNVYDELSSATYAGLTTPQFEADPSQNHAMHDRLPVRRYAASATHSTLLFGRALLQTTLYGNHTTRHWQRQDFDRTDGGRDYERIVGGDNQLLSPTNAPFPDDGSAVFFRDSTGNRNRSFTVGGIEPRMTVDYELGPVRNELIGGFRFHVERADEQRIDGQHARSNTGVIREDEFRTGYGFAGYLQNRFILLERLRITPGLRVEHFIGQRTILRARQEGVPTDLQPRIEESTAVTALIPGLGVSFDVVEPLTVFAGVHRGFAPPRTKDAITPDGVSLELEAEYSWNYELGVRSTIGKYFYGEVAGFFLDFSNQIIPPAEATGIVAQDPNLVGVARINGGQTTHLGVESALTFDTARFLNLSFELPLTVTYTYVRAEFGEGWNEDLVGNRLPYAPEHLVSARLRLGELYGFSGMVNATYVSEQFADKHETVAASVDGTNGLIPARFLLDARLSYKIAPIGVSLFVSGKNLTDERVVVSRRPQGIQPAMFRQVLAGIQGEL